MVEITLHRLTAPTTLLSLLLLTFSVVGASPASASCDGTDDASSGSEPVSPACVRYDEELDAEALLGGRLNADRRNAGVEPLIGWTDLLVASRWWAEQPNAGDHADPDLDVHVGYHTALGSLTTSVELPSGTPTHAQLEAAVDTALDQWRASSKDRAIWMAERWDHIGAGADIEMVLDGPYRCDPGCTVRYRLVLSVTFRDPDGTTPSTWLPYLTDGSRPPNHIDEATTFVDVPHDHLFHGEVEQLFDADVTRGCNKDQTRFCPDDGVTRGEMAAFLVRALGLPAGSARFDDVPSGHLFADDVAALADAGITHGCNEAGTRYCPSRTVTRAEMAGFLVRALDLPAGSATFEDVPAGHTFRADIAALADAGITRGCDREGTVFCPSTSVTRAEMAAFLSRSGVLDPGWGS